MYQGGVVEKIALITVVGLGSGDYNQVTIRVDQMIRNAVTVYTRTLQHPAIKSLIDQGVNVTSFDPIYEKNDTFFSVYEEIVQRLIQMAVQMETNILYAVPGHPMVAEMTVSLLKERCAIKGVSLQIVGGQSFLDEAFIRLQFDPIDGFQLLDAVSMQKQFLHPHLHTIIGQVYDRFTASDVKLCLMERYDDEYSVVVAHELGVRGQEKIYRLPLYKIDRLQDYGNQSLVYIPKTKV